MPETSYQSESPKGRKLSNLKEFALNLIIVSLGILTAFGVFVYYKSYQRQKDIAALIPNAKSALTAKEYSKAISLYIDAEREFPNDVEVKRALGDLYFMKQKKEEAIAYYENVDRIGDLNDEEISNLGNLYLQSGKEDNAVTLWKGKTLKPKDQYSLAQVYLNRKEYDNYFAELQKISAYKEPLIYLQVNNPSLSVVLANIEKASVAESISDEAIDIALFKSQISDAQTQLNSGKKDFSELIQISAFGNLNQCYKLGSRISALRASLEKQKIPVFQVDFLEGKCKNQSGEPDLAQTLIQKAVDYDSTNVEYREELANSYFLKKDLVNLKKTYEDIFVIQKTSNLYFNYAGFLYKLDQRDDALTAYDEALKLSDDQKQKEKIAKYIYQINFLEKKDLSVCSRDDLSILVDKKDTDMLIISGYCSIKNNKDVDTENLTDDEKSYFDALKSKNQKDLEKVLDRDSEGYMTTYYNAVGNKL